MTDIQRFPSHSEVWDAIEAATDGDISRHNDVVLTNGTEEFTFSAPAFRGKQPDSPALPDASASRGDTPLSETEEEIK